MRSRYNYDLKETTCAASLAHHGILRSVEEMDLSDVDLTSISAEQLASLASCVTGHVHISRVTGCGLVTFLESVKSKELLISSQSLGSEETKALVKAMETGVESVEVRSEVTLDIRNLVEYSGQGKCREIECSLDTADRYRKHLRPWAKACNWTVTFHKNKIFRIERM